MNAIPPVVLVIGSDRFRVVDAFAAEKDALVAKIDPADGVDTFDGADTDVVGRAVDAARTPSMFGGRRLVVMRDPIGPETVETLRRYVEAPADDVTVLIMQTTSGRELKAVGELRKAIAAVGSVVVVKGSPDTPKDVARFIDEVASSQGLALGPGAAAHLAARLGADSGRIVSVVEQLAIADSDGTVTIDDIDEYVVGPGSSKPWDLTDAIDAGDVARALTHLRSMLADRHPLEVQAALIGHVRKLLMAVESGATSAADLETLLSVKSYPARKIFGRIRAVGRDAIAAAHREVANADAALRGGSGLSDAIVMDVLVVRLCRRLGGRR